MGGPGRGGARGRDDGDDDGDDLVALLLACHARIRRFVALAAAAGARDDVPAAERADACRAVARYFRDALPLHVEDEERGLVPRLIGRDPVVDDALATMAAQHRDHGPGLDALLAAVAAVRAAPADVEARRVLAAAAGALDAAFAAHLDLEERVVFPAIGRLLDAGVRAELVRELRARRRAAGAPDDAGA
ncbi:MAG: hemerythrin domain-containing protein [Kofleriaceae bacterium]|nr:hemerythrin domain-containing protein [Kofleriaceae bacterium]MCB9572783.1 hemerythrin domain-containing protein [Kofleriaceae bacterium]